MIQNNQFNENISGNSGAIKAAKDCIYILEKHIEKYNNNLLAKSKILRYIGTYYMISGDKKMQGGALYYATVDSIE